MKQIGELITQNTELKDKIAHLEKQVQEISTPDESEGKPANLELELKKYKIQNENLKLSIQHMTKTYEQQRLKSDG